MSVHYTDQALIAQYLKVSGQIAQKEMQIKKGWHCAGCGLWHEGTEKGEQGLESYKAELFKRLIERKADNTKCEAGTAYLSDHLNVKVTNRDVLLDFARKHWDNGGGALVVIKPPVDAVRDWQAMHEGKLPPGIETSIFTRLNIRGGK